MRQIAVSTEVYAAIWAAHQPGDKDESEILARILKASPAPPTPASSTAPPAIGFSDPRFNINLEAGFEIFRVYKGVEYRAKAENGKWTLLNTGKSYPSLNQLSGAVSDSPENAWESWYYLKDGKRTLVKGLRQ